MSDAEEDVDENVAQNAPDIADEETEEVEDTQDDEKEMIVYNKIFIGTFDDTIPETKRKLVRIFTSSTFTGI